MNKINLWQFSSLLIIVMIASFLGVGIYALINFAKVDAYIGVLIAGLLGGIILYLFIKIANYEPDLPLNEKINKLFGNKIGTIINILLILIYFISLISVIYDLTSFISSQFLSETPSLLIGFIFIVIAIYMNSKGIEIISRVSFILIIINIVLYTISLIGTLPSFELSNLKPILENGFSPPLKGSVYVAFMNMLTIVSLLMIPKNSIINNKNYNKVVILSYIIGILFMFFVVFTTIGSLGIELASIYQYPEYVVLKRINLFSFIDRIENIMVIQWIFGLFVVTSIFIYYISNTIKTYTRNKILISIISFTALIASDMIFKSNTFYNNYIIKYTLYPKYLLLFILIIIFITSLLKTKKQN